MKNKSTYIHIFLGILIGISLIFALQATNDMFQRSCAKYGYDFDGFGFHGGPYPEPLCRVDENLTSLHHLQRLYPNMKEGIYEDATPERMKPPENLPTPSKPFDEEHS